MGAVTLSSRGLTLARGYFDGGDKRARAERVFMCTRCLYSWGTRNLICGLRRLICGLDLVNVGKLIRTIDNLAKRCSRRWMGKFVILWENFWISLNFAWQFDDIFVFDIFNSWGKISFSSIRSVSIRGSKRYVFRIINYSEFRFRLVMD